MLNFEKLDLSKKETYLSFLRAGGQRSCEYAFANLYMWGRQRAAFVGGYLVLFSQFSRRSVYPWPKGSGDLRPALDAIIHDACRRGIPCRITGMGPEQAQLLESMYPGRFRIHNDRDGYDYVYAIDDLADLKGRKYQRKRNHFNRFCQSFPHHTAAPIGPQNLPLVRSFAESWFEQRQAEDPSADLHMERSALKKALDHYEELDMEGLLLLDGDTVLAFTMASFLSEDTVDVHFEKANTDAEGAYTAINCLFARYLRSKYPHIRFLNREDDMGLEGLRKAKLSYLPHHMVEKNWACLLEDGCEY